MSDGDALMRAVLAQPLEDAPRLVYADWLEENGDRDRARFIRLQVDAARTDRPGYADRLQMEADALFWRHRVEWSAPVIEAMGTDRKYIGLADWHRGFVSVLNVPGDRFLERASGIFAVTPIERVWVYAGNYVRFSGSTTFGVVRGGHRKRWPRDHGVVPNAVWKLLPGDDTRRFRQGRYAGRLVKVYQSQKAVESAVSDAMVRFGRVAALVAAGRA